MENEGKGGLVSVSENGLAPPTVSTRKTGVSLSSMFGYGAGNFALALLGLVVAVNLNFLYTDYVGLGAGLVAWSLLLARLFDAITDPVMGYLSDRTNSRWGRRRPFFIGAAIPLGIAFYYLFSPRAFDDPSQHQLHLWGYMLFWYVLTYFIWTVAAVPYFSLGAELTDDYQERVKVIAVREACALVGLLVATVLPSYLIYTYGGQKGYSFMAGILGAGLAVFLLLSGFSTREREEFQGRESMNPYAGWLQTFRNPHFRSLLWPFIFSAIAGAVPAVLIIYISIYIVGTPEWWDSFVPEWLATWAFYLLLYFAAGMLALPFWNRLARAIGKKATWGTAIVIATFTSAGYGLLEEGSVIYFSVVLFIGGASFGNFITLPPSMVADVIDWDEAETGKRREGSYFAIWAFTTKFCIAITGFTSLQVLEHVGYIPGAEQSDYVKAWMLGMYSWFPAFFYLLSGIMLFRFKFTSSDLEEVQRKVGRA